MSNAWGIRYRLLLEQIETLADELGSDQPPASAKVTEHTVRLLTFTAILLRQHHINMQGQCRFCGWSRLKWRFWHRRPRCTVFRALVFVMSEGLDVVWWQLFESMGNKPSLENVRESMTQRDHDTTRLPLADTQHS
ncbi:MAG: hypothetical protein ACRDSP_20005 [Pseudonocardiaceae bacterium]